MVADIKFVCVINNEERMIKIEEREILVDNAWISLQTDSLIIIDIETKSKYPDVCGYSDKSFGLCSNERTIHKGTDPRYTDVEIDIPGFRIDSVRAGRYDVRVYLLKDKAIESFKYQMIWETGRK